MENILEFLSKILNEGLSYSTLNTSGSAFALIFDLHSGDEKILKRFLKGAYNKNSLAPKYATAWDLSPDIWKICIG
nr:unnamed protein product [Callosobruchus analis]